MATLQAVGVVLAVALYQTVTYPARRAAPVVAAAARRFRRRTA